MNQDLYRYVSLQQLRDLGITAEGDELEKLLQEVNAKIDEAIGEEVIDSLDDDQLTQLKELEESGDEQALAEFITKNVDEYQQIVADNIDIAIGELVQDISTSQE